MYCRLCSVLHRLYVNRVHLDKHIVADVTQNSTNGWQLVLTEARYHMFLVSQQCALKIVKFLYSRILGFEYLKDDS
jgi:hypothetical protein